MKILTNQVFLDETDRFEADTEYDVEEGRGYYFCRVGWAKNLDAVVEPEEQPSEVTLDIHDSIVETSADHG